MKPIEITTQMLESLTAAQIEDLQISYAVMDPLEFARHLNTLEIPDKIHGELLRAKVAQKPTERDDVMQMAIESAMAKFWNRLSVADDSQGLHLG